MSITPYDIPLTQNYVYVLIIVGSILTVIILIFIFYKLGKVMYLKYKFRQTMSVSEGAVKNGTNFTNKVKLHTTDYTTQITEISSQDLTA